MLSLWSQVVVQKMLLQKMHGPCAIVLQIQSIMQVQVAFLQQSKCYLYVVNHVANACM